MMRWQACSDGMSGQSFGIGLDLFQAASPDQGAQTLHGCCRLAPSAPWNPPLKPNPAIFPII